MPDSKAGSWAAIGGAEILNSQRTIAYINNFNLPITIDADCWCPSINELLNDCPPEPDGPYDADGYSYPSTDPAPWYDPAIPESGDFLGFLTTEFEGLGSTFTRSTFDILSGGAVLGKLRAQARPLTWRGFLFGRTCCAAEYGLRWLTALLSKGGDCCIDQELDILLCCPDVTGGAPPPQSCGVGIQPNQISCDTGMPITGDMPAFSESAQKDAFRTFYKVGLADGPRRGGTRALGCGNCEDTGGGCFIEAEFTLIAGNPYMHREPEVPCGEAPFAPCETCDEQQADGDFWTKLTTTTYPASEDDSEACIDKLECTASPADCNVDPYCPTAQLPTIPEFVDPCGCESLFKTRRCCYISNDIYGQFFEGVPQIEVFSGDKPLYNVTVKIFENPQERCGPNSEGGTVLPDCSNCQDSALFDICNLCDSITVRYIPPQSTLTIDGLTKRVSIECPGNNVQPAEALMVSSFRWPVFNCIDYFVTIEADCCGKAPLALLRDKSPNINTLNGQPGDILKVRSTAGFPASGTLYMGKYTLTYTGLTAMSFIGVNALPVEDKTFPAGTQVFGSSTDPDCTQGVSDLATTKVTVIPREM